MSFGSIAIGALTGFARGGVPGAISGAVDGAINGGKPNGGSPAGVWGTPPFVGGTQSFEGILAALEKGADKLPDKVKEEVLEKLEKKILKEVDDPTLRKKIEDAFDKLKTGNADQAGVTCPT